MLLTSLALLADIYIPSLITIVSIHLFRLNQQRKHRQLRASAFFICCGLAWALGLSAADSVFQWWAQANWDYSTHTAIAWVLVLQIASISQRHQYLACSSLCFYAALMSILSYHNINDMLSTSLAVVPFGLFLQIVSQNLFKVNVGSAVA